MVIELGVSYGGRGRAVNEKFVDYMQRIVTHPSYKGMPAAIDDEGKIRWNAPSHRPPGGKWSNLHDERLAWWRTKAGEIGVPLEGDWISKVAKTIHPFKKKPCQTCGRVMSLLYEYPTQNLVRSINAIPGLERKFEYSQFRNIYAVVQGVGRQCGQSGLAQLRRLLSIPESVAANAQAMDQYLQKHTIPSEPKGLLSPGAMSNAPDRLDGFHTYNICCRGGQDTGRTRENLRTYGSDRRAFEYWCEGNWAAADEVMNQTVVAECVRCGKIRSLTADHVGPISLGFCHRPEFRALCRSCNSARNNRMDYRDVRALIEDEKNGQRVLSWHAKYIWDLFKDRVHNDSDALKLSNMMRVNQHYFLMMLVKIKQAGYVGFLKTLLHPEYAAYKYSIVGFNKRNFSYTRLVQVPRAETYAKSKASRTTRIALVALDSYYSKENRRVPLTKDPELDASQAELMEALKSGNYARARHLFESYMKTVGQNLVSKGIPRGYWKSQQQTW